MQDRYTYINIAIRIYTLELKISFEGLGIATKETNVASKYTYTHHLVYAALYTADVYSSTECKIINDIHRAAKVGLKLVEMQ